MRAYAWLLLAVFVIGLVYPPAALAIGSASLTAACLVVLLLMLTRSR